MIIHQTMIGALIDAQIEFTKKMIGENLGKNSSTDSIYDTLLAPLIDMMATPVYGSLHPTFRDFMAPGVILSITYILSCGLTATSLVAERKEMERSLVAGVTQIQVMAGMFYLNFFLVCAQVALLLVFAFLVFGITIKGNAILVISVVLLHGILGMCYGELDELNLDQLFY